jgi:hypothetical protein
MHQRVSIRIAHHCAELAGRMQAAAATVTPAMLTNVWISRVYICDMCWATYGHLAEHL